MGLGFREKVIAVKVGQWAAVVRWLPFLLATGLALKMPVGLHAPIWSWGIWQLDALTRGWLVLVTLTWACLRVSTQGVLWSGVLVGMVAALLPVLQPWAWLTLTALGALSTLLSYRFANRDPRWVAVMAVLRPLVVYGLLRWLAQGVWPVQVTVMLGLVGGGWALWEACGALATSRTRDAVQSALLGAAIACVGLTSSLGVIAGLWAMLAYAVCAAGPVSPPYFPLLAVAFWFVVAAATAGASWLLAGVLSFAGLCCCFAVVMHAPRSLWPAAWWYGSFGMVALLIAPITERLLIPVLIPLAAGLSQLGTVELWAWLGVGARNAAQQRVLLLPAVILAALALVIGSAVRLVFSSHPVVGQTDTAGELGPVGRKIRQGVWWWPGE